MAGLTVTRSGGAANSSATLRIRGITTIGDSNPLVLIDGIPGSIDRVNPNDVESISVLKDAASASIYGSRAAAGVVLITTKRGKSNQLSIDYTFEYGIETPTAVPKQVDAATTMRMRNERIWNGVDNTGSEYPLYPKELIDNYANLHVENPDLYPDADWYKKLIRNSTPRKSHILSFSGGNQFVKTKASLDYSQIGGLYEGKDYNRFTFRVNNDITPNKYLSGFIDINGLMNDAKDPVVTLTPNMNYPASLFAPTWSDGRITQGDAASLNLLARLQQGGSIRRNGQSFGGRVGVNITPIDGLKITGIFSPTINISSEKNFSKKIPFTRLETPEIIAGYIGGHLNTNLLETRSHDYAFTTQFLVNYDKKFKGHSVGILGGYENYYSFNESLNASRLNYELSDYPYLNIGNQNFQYNAGEASEYAYRSWFGRVGYDYMGKYLLQINSRFDASSRFAKGYRLGIFPSVSAGWVISEEKFFSKIEFLSYTKLRASWGTLGNERIGSLYPYQSTLSFGNALLNVGQNSVSASTASVNKYPIQDITWETTESYNIGIDLASLSNRLRITADIYKKKTKDMLLALEIPRFIGLTKPSQNAGSMHTIGWELETGWNDRIGKFRYSVSFNLSDYKSVMGNLRGTEFIGSKIRTEGSQFDEWFGYKANGLFQTQAEVDAGPKINTNVRPGDIRFHDISGPNGVPDNKITPEYDRVWLGGSLPRYLYGGNIQFGYKSFDLSIAVQGVGQQKAQIEADWLSAYNNYAVDIVANRNYWSKYNSFNQNETANFPRLSPNFNSNNYSALSNYWLFNGAYFRLKNISLSYSLPEKYCKIVKARGCKFYFTSTDLFSLDKFPKNRDPEASSFFITNSYLLGLSINF